MNTLKYIASLFLVFTAILLTAPKCVAQQPIPPDTIMINGKPYKMVFDNHGQVIVVDIEKEKEEAEELRKYHRRRMEDRRGYDIERPSPATITIFITIVPDTTSAPNEEPKY